MGDYYDRYTDCPAMAHLRQRQSRPQTAPPSSSPDAREPQEEVGTEIVIWKRLQRNKLPNSPFASVHLNYGIYFLQNFRTLTTDIRRTFLIDLEWWKNVMVNRTPFPVIF